MELPRMLRRPDVEKMVGLSRSAIYAAMDRNDFPRPIKVGLRAVAWRLSDIERWLEQRPLSLGW